MVGPADIARSVSKGPFAGVIRVVFVGFGAFALYHALNAVGYGWLMVPLAVLVSVGWAFFAMKNKQRGEKRRAQWDRWEEAVFDDVARPKAILEVRQELQQAQRLGKHLCNEAAHLAVILAELLDASERSEDACEVLGKIRLDELDATRQVVVRHARAVVQLAAGRLDDLSATLGAHVPPTEPDMDARMALLGRMLLVERGKIDEALDGLDSIAARVPNDETGLADDALVVRACALAASDREEEALGLLRGLGEPILGGLAKLGAPRVRGLASRALEALAKTTKESPVMEESAGA
jgi:hypothetical protein